MLHSKRNMNTTTTPRTGLSGGQSILELIIAIAIFSLIAATLISLVAGSFIGLAQGGEQTEAEALAQEGVEAVKAIYGEAWNEIIYSTSSVSIAGNQFVFDGEGTTETIGQYTRTISFNDVCRNTSNDIVLCPGNYVDVHTKEIVVTVTWNIRSGVTNTVERSGYITNWDSRDFVQTNWIGGSGQALWSDTTRYDSGDGNVQSSTPGQLTLISFSGPIIDDDFDTPSGTSNDWPFTTALNYTYDQSKIIVSGGMAQLVASGGSIVSGDTVNPDFDTDANNWAYLDWETGNVDVTGVLVASGGNPNGHVNINIPGRKNNTLSGLWEQSFTTTVDNPTIATTTFDWSITAFSNIRLTSYQLYVFVDSSSGDPTLGTEVWSSGEIAGTSAWATVPEIDVSSRLGTQGTYYLKIVARAVTSGGSGNPGDKTATFDNVALHYEQSTGGSYPIDNPSIQPVSSFAVPSVQSWSGFTETATMNGGAIYYQLSNDNGSSWQYWNGFLWAIAGSADYNSASIIDANIGTFGITNEQILFKATLESDGTQLVQLDTVSIGFSVSVSLWSFSPWDVGGGEVTPTGSLLQSGGNPDGHATIVVTEGGNDEVGGFWEQRFTTFTNNPSPVTLDFDYIVADFNPTANIAQMRVYIDTTSGAPVNQVGPSIDVTGVGSWTSASQIDASSALANAGTYYLKIAFWVETPSGRNGPFSVSYDNVLLNLGSSGYATFGSITSSAFDMGNSSALQAIEWNDSSSCPSCIVEFEASSASDADGSPGVWTSWYGEGGPGTMFTKKDGTLISTDLNNNQWMRYRVTLSGDGSNTPILEEVRINYK